MGVFDKITDGLTPSQVEDMVVPFLYSFGRISSSRLRFTAPICSAPSWMRRLDRGISARLTPSSSTPSTARSEESPIPTVT